MTLKRLLSTGLGSLLLFILLAPVAQTQNYYVNGSTERPIPAVGHNYVGILNETVNPADGTLSIRLDVQVPKARGFTLPFAFIYNSNSTHYPAASPGSGAHVTTVHWLRLGDFISLGGWGYSLPKISLTPANVVTETGSKVYTCAYDSDYVFHDPNGGSHNLQMSVTSNTQDCAHVSPRPRQVLAGEDYMFAGLTTGLCAGCQLGVPQPVTVTGRDNTKYTFSDPGKYPVNGSYSLLVASFADSVEDRNGNIVTLTDSGDGAFTVKDTAGRVALSSSGFGSSGNTISVSGMASPYTLTWGAANVDYSVQSTQPGDLTTFCSPTMGNVVDTNPVVTAVELPNGKEFQFSYDQTYGVVTKITYPTGGYVRYVWGLNSLSQASSFPNGSDPIACLYQYGSPAVLQRFVSFDGQTEKLSQTFTYNTTWQVAPNEENWSQKTTSISTHDVVRGKTFVTTYAYSPEVVENPPNDNIPVFPQIPVEQSIKYFDFGNSTTPIKVVNKTWLTQYQLSTEQEELLAGAQYQESEVDYAYGVGGITERDEYDFGTPSSTPARGGLLRKTVYTYNPQGLVQDEPLTTLTYDGANTLAAERDVTYDSPSAVAAVPGLILVTHDETNYGPTSTVQRGNATLVTEKCLQAAPACSGNSVTAYTYDETGQELSSKDPNGNTTQNIYADSYTSGTPTGSTNAYVTRIQYPSTNEIAHTVNYSYSYADGRLTQSTDENAQITSFKYADSLDRPTETDFADGGQTSYTYNDGAPSPSVTTSKKMTSSQSLINVSVMDGVGHVTENETTSVTPVISATTAYDGLGRVYTVSNAHVSTSNPTDGTTTYTYDSIGRITQVAEQDASILTTTYSGNTTTVTDEAGHKRETANDGIGRLTTAWEPDSSNNLTVQSVYTYDALGNQTSVLQAGSRARSFAFNSLSRLTSSSNPESGTVAYVYDANGNLISRTDARSITTTYGYDQLNRLNSRIYSDTTPQAVFGYDGTGCAQWTINTAMSNAIGRLSCETTFGGTGGSTGTAQDYDSMGRVLVREQCDPNNCGAGASFEDINHYDLLGDLSQINYQLTNLAGGGGILYTYDGAGRTTLITSGDANANEPATLFTADATLGYWPNGALRLAKYGNNLGVTAAYNSRLQPCRLDVNSSVKAFSQCTDATPTGSLLDFSYGYAPNANNGNILTWTATGAQSFSRSYAYDNLNRLTSMTGPGGSCTGLTWTYDTWGNRTAQTPTAGTCPSLSKTANTLNQIVGYTYDASGNLLNDGSHTYAYDAENRLTQVDGGSTATYLYDADGQRVLKNTSTLSVAYLRDARSYVIAELEDDIWHNQYVYEDGHLLAEYAGIAVYFDTQDHLGSSTLLTTVTGTVQDCNAFYPFGEQDSTLCTSTNTTTHKFNGKERDTESNLDNFEARYMASSLGRFMSPDPGNSGADSREPQTWNAYSYVRNNPLALTDPSGMVYCRPARVDEPTVSMVCDVTNSQYFLNPKKYEGEGYTYFECNCDTGIDKDAHDHPNGNVSNDNVGDFLVAAAVFLGYEGIFSPSISPNRRPQDENVNPDPPSANDGENGYIGTSPQQRAALQKDIEDARANGATDIRVNQHQVNAQGERVGINRPDLQFTDKNGVRQYIEYERSPAGRGAEHAERIQANDPAGRTTVKFAGGK